MKDTPQKRSFIRPILFTLGIISLCLGFLGALLPVLPTTPFLILSCWLFSKSSPKLFNYLYYHPKFGHMLQDWKNNRVIRPKAKVYATLLIVPVFTYSIYNLNAYPYLQITLFIICLCLLYFILSRNSLPLSHSSPSSNIGEKELELTTSTLSYYHDLAERFWQGTKDHDVSQNINAFLKAINLDKAMILDFGCGPGRDLLAFKERGHTVIGLDGSEKFCEMARSYANVKVLQQNFLQLKLEQNYYDGIFSNASLFHIPKKELPRVLRELKKSLKNNGVLFCSIPRGDKEQLKDRYAHYMEFPVLKNFMEDAGYTYIEHFYRPDHLPLEERPWLASLWRKTTP